MLRSNGHPLINRPEKKTKSLLMTSLNKYYWPVDIGLDTFGGLLTTSRACLSLKSVRFNNNSNVSQSCPAFQTFPLGNRSFILCVLPGLHHLRHIASYPIHRVETKLACKVQGNGPEHRTLTRTAHKEFGAALVYCSRWWPGCIHYFSHWGKRPNWVLLLRTGARKSFYQLVKEASRHRGALYCNVSKGNWQMGCEVEDEAP